MNLLNVTYVVEWKTLAGDAPLEPAIAMEHIRGMGAQEVWSNPDVSLYRMPGATHQPALVTSRSLLVVSALHSGAFGESEQWHAPLAVAAAGNAADMIESASMSQGLIHLTDRSVVAVRNGSTLTVDEPVFIPQQPGLRSATLTHHLEVPSGAGTLAFSDGTAIGEGTTIRVAVGPVDSVYPANVNGEPPAGDPSSTELGVELTQGPTVSQLPNQTASSFPDVVITPQPNVDAGAGHWIVDRQAADAWWQL